MIDLKQILEREVPQMTSFSDQGNEIRVEIKAATPDLFRRKLEGIMKMSGYTLKWAGTVLQVFEKDKEDD